MVFASSPVASESLLAALPVGAARSMVAPDFLNAVIIPSVVVVLPVPGPPVRTVILLLTAVSMA